MKTPVRVRFKAIPAWDRLRGLRAEAEITQEVRLHRRYRYDPLNKRRDRQTAYHEAGHAIIGRKLNLQMLAARCDPHGFVSTVSGAYPGCLRLLLFTLAGGIAERRVAGGHDVRFGTFTDDKENQDTLRYTAKTKRGRQLTLERAQLETRGMVARHWRGIDKFARELYKRGTIPLSSKPLRIKA